MTFLEIYGIVALVILGYMAILLMLQEKLQIPILHYIEIGSYTRKEFVHIELFE